METAIDAFQGLQIHNVLGLLTSSKTTAIACAASNVGASVFWFSTSPLAPTTITNEDRDSTIADDGVSVDASFIAQLNYGSLRVYQYQDKY